MTAVAVISLAQMIALAVKTAIVTAQMNRVKAVVLGCTHYPFLRKAIAALFPEGTPLIDGNAGSVRQLRRRLEEEGLLSNRQGPGRVTFLSSSEEPSVLQRMQTMLELCANESKSAPEGEKEVRS